MTPRQTVFLALPLVAAFVLVLTYLRLFSSTVVIVVLLVLYVAVSLMNRRKFSKGKTDRAAGSDDRTPGSSHLRRGAPRALDRTAVAKTYLGLESFFRRLLFV